MVYYENGTNGKHWPGIVSIDETPEYSARETFLEGEKRPDLVTQTDFALTVATINVPRELWTFMGVKRIFNGFYITGQATKQLSLCYRTMTKDKKYRLHIVTNITPEIYSFNTVTDTDRLNPKESRVDFHALPTTGTAYPYNHIVLDGRLIANPNMALIEDILYGATDTPRIPTMSEILEILETEWFDVVLSTGGLHTLIPATYGDLYFSTSGFYYPAPGSRIQETSTAGIYELEVT